MRILTLVLLFVVAVGCYEKSDCITGDFTHFVQMDDETMEIFEVDWLADAKACSIGNYIVCTPADGESDKLWIISSNRKPVVSLGNETLTVFQSERRVLAQFDNRDEDGVYHTLSYAGHDPAQNIDITLFDFDLDGETDARSRYYRDSGTSIHEHRIADDWHELKKQNGTYGYIVDGKFYDLKKGKAKLIERANAVR